MLRWYRKNIHKRQFVWLQLMGWSLVLHSVFLSLVFLGYSEHLSEFVFTMHNRELVDCEVVVMLEPQKPIQKKIAAPTKQVVKKTVVSKTALVQQKKIVPKKNIPKKPMPKKVISKKPLAKPVAKKVTVPVKPQEQKHVAKQVDSKPRVQQQPVHKHVTSPIQQASHAEHVDAKKIVVSYADARAAYRYKELQQELARHWWPPYGVPSGCACQITVHIDTSGAVQNVHINSSSGILMFDVQVRTAILATQWPRWSWGMSVPITLNA